MRSAAPEDAEAGGALHVLPEVVRRVLAAGLSGFFLTEEAIRKAVGETLPQDWSDFAVEQSERARTELLERLSVEVGRSLENVDLARLLQKLLEGSTIEIQASVRLRPEEPGRHSQRRRRPDEA